MAIITKLNEGFLKNPKESKDTEAVFYIIDDFDERYVQIDTFGSKERKYKNKVSQSIRIKKDIAVELVKILKDSFMI